MASLLNILKLKEELEESLSRNKDALTDEELRLKERCENDFYTFLKESWHALMPDITYRDGWHIKAAADHLMSAYNGHINTLLMNIPSGHSKSSEVNVFFPAWVWTKEPHLKFLNVSGTYSLSERDTLLCRQLITSKWYQRLWGHKVQISKELNTKERYANTAGGVKIIKTIGSTMGERAHFVIIDDPNGMEDIYYATHREYINAGVDATVSTRIDKISETRKGCLIIIQQRVHQFDLTGHWLAKNDPSIIHLMLPAYFEEKRRCITIPLSEGEQPWRDPRTEEGELLWPEMWDAEDYRRREMSLGTAINVQAQMQQNPTPAGGNLIKQGWFRLWKQDALPDCRMKEAEGFIIQSWDTALSTEESACDSAVTTWGVFKDELRNNNLILLSCWSGKLENPDLRKMMIKCANNYFTCNPKAPYIPGPKPDVILVEEAMNGKALIADLKYGGIANVIGFNPRTHGFKLENGTSPTHKLARTHFASMIIETGIVWLPMIPQSKFTKLYGNAERFLEACLRCPRGEGQDLIDAMAQAFIWARMRGLIHHSGENPEATPINFNEHIIYQE